jgi:UDP-glucose 4-epimerase
MTRYFQVPVMPTPMGFDPRIQFVHEDDAIEALYKAVREDHPGTYNVAGDGVLYLSQAIRTAGKVPLPIMLPFANAVASVIRRQKLVDFSPEQIRFLLYGRVGDVSRLKEVFGYTPRFSTREAFEDFVATRRLAKLFTREQMEQWEHDVYRFLARRGTAAVEVR